MASTCFKLESGLQLLTRLMKKAEIKNIYPNFFQNGPNYGEIAEIFGSVNVVSRLLYDLVSIALLNEIGVLIFITDGNFNSCNLVKTLRCKLIAQTIHTEATEEVDTIILKYFSNLHVIEVYDSEQYYTTIHNLENILMKHSDISLILFDTLTAFYWSEQSLKITRMDIYLKKLLLTVQKATKGYKVLVVYTRPEYFSSSKEPLEYLEACCEVPTLERLNYRIKVTDDGNNIYSVEVRTCHNQFKHLFRLMKDEVNWL